MRQKCAMQGLATVILFITTWLPGPLFATLRDQPQSATALDQLDLRFWKDPNIIDELKDIVFDFDTHTNLPPNRQFLSQTHSGSKTIRAYESSLLAHRSSRGTSYTTLPSLKDAPTR